MLKKILAALLIAGSVVLAITYNTVAPIEVIASDNDDALVVERDANGATLLHVRSPGGIGSAKVRLSDRHPGIDFTVILHLNALEGFAVRTPNEVHRIGINSAGAVVLEPADSTVLQMNASPARAKTANFAVVVSTGNLAEAVSELRLEWVDYYR